MVNPVNAPNSDDKLWAGLSYVGMACCLIPTLVIFFLKKGESTFIKFHALQAIFLWLVLLVVNIVVMALGAVMSGIPGLNVLFGIVTGFAVPLVYLGAWLYVMIMTFTGKDVRLPVLADFIDQNLMG